MGGTEETERSQSSVAGWGGPPKEQERANGPSVSFFLIFFFWSGYRKKEPSLPTRSSQHSIHQPQKLDQPTGSLYFTLQEGNFCDSFSLLESVKIPNQKRSGGRLIQVPYSSSHEINS